MPKGQDCAIALEHAPSHPSPEAANTKMTFRTVGLFEWYCVIVLNLCLSSLTKKPAYAGFFVDRSAAKTCPAAGEKCHD